MTLDETELKREASLPDASENRPEQEEEWL